VSTQGGWALACALQDDALPSRDGADAPDLESDLESAAVKIAGWVAAALFLFSAAVQWNDPDPLRWIFGYGVAAGISAAFSLGYPVRALAAVAALVYAGLAIAVAPESLPGSFRDLIAPAMKTIEIEEARESLGLGLCGLWCAVLALRPGASPVEEPG